MAIIDKSVIDDRIVASSVLSWVQFGALVLLLWWCLRIVALFLNLLSGVPSSENCCARG